MSGVERSGSDSVRIIRMNGRWFHRCPDHGVSVRSHRRASDAAEAGRRHLAEDRGVTRQDRAVVRG